MSRLPALVLSWGDGEKEKEMKIEMLLILIYLIMGKGVSVLVIDEVKTKSDAIKSFLSIIGWPIVALYALLVLLPKHLIKLWIDLPDTDEQIKDK